MHWGRILCDEWVRAEFAFFKTQFYESTTDSATVRINLQPFLGIFVFKHILTPT